MKQMHTYQFWLAVALVLFGVLLLIVAFFLPPAGLIDPTVLTAYGETLTFAGALIGLDYKYKVSTHHPNAAPYSLHRSPPRRAVLFLFMPPNA